MTAQSTGRCFQIPRLHKLRSAKNLDTDHIDGVWTSINNDEFYSLSMYVAAFTKVRLNGYGKPDEPGAYEACSRTLDALEEALRQMNQSEELKLLAGLIADGATGKYSIEDVEAAWDSLLSMVPGQTPLAALLEEIKQEFIGWSTGLCEGDISALIKYAPAPEQRDTELAFSGGGMRAAAFALGVLMYVADAGRFGRIRQISSVSGGSITNGFLANSITELHDTTGLNGIMEESLAGFAKRLADDGIPLEKVGRKGAGMLGITLFCFVSSILCIILAALDIHDALLTYAAFLFGCFVYSGFWTYRIFTMTTDTFVGAWFAYIINGTRVKIPRFSPLDILSGGIYSWLISAEGLRIRKLREINSPLKHVFTATDLRNGEHFHFSQSWATSNTFGVTDTGDIRIDEAVRASAAFPGALPPVKLRLDRLHLPSNLTVGQKHLQLVDGGVRDNLGHVFQTQLLGDVESQRESLTDHGEGQLTIVVDASAPRGVADLGEGILARIPILRSVEQLVTFPRVVGIMNQSNSEARALGLASQFAESGKGIVVQIHESPVEACKKAIGDPVIIRSLLRSGRGSGRVDVPHKLRAEAALKALVRNDPAAESLWNGERNQNQKIPTSLDGLGADQVAALIRHGYVLTMCQAHIEFNWLLPPDDRWSDGRFSAMLKVEPPP